MSVHKRKGRFQVRWREHGRQRSRTFDRKGDADAFDREVRRRLQLGPHLVRELTRASLTLEEFVRTGFRTHSATLSPATRRGYAWALELHLGSLLGEPVIAIDVPLLAAHQQWLLDHGRSASTVREAMTKLSGILQVAVEHGHISGNPARALRKVAAEQRDEVRALSPAELEALILSFTGRERAICILGGHFGLRPIEIRMAPWSNLTDEGLVVGRARTKSSAARTRVLSAPRVTARELRAWRLESGGRGDDPIIGPMSEAALHQWGWKKLQPAARKITGRGDVTLYMLRHSHASALHYCGWTVPAAARRMGHGGPLHLRTYAHVIDALEGRDRYKDLDALIEAARTGGSPGALKAAGLQED